MLLFGCNTFGRELIFLQDNDPKHSSAIVKQCFDNHRVQVMKWPSQLNFLNTIGHLWEKLSKRIKNKIRKHAEENFQKFQGAWNQIPASVMHNFIDSMQRRCVSILEAKGFGTKY